MALTPQSIEYGVARLENTVLLNERDLEASLTLTEFPDSHIPGTTVSVTVSNVNGNANGGAWALALVEDATDVGGNFTDAAGTALAAGVLCYRQISDGTDPVGTWVLGDGSGPDASLNAALVKAGTMRLVLIRGSAPLEAKRLGAVDTGATSEYHADSDGSLATGTLVNVTIQVKRAGWVGRRAKLPASGLTVSPSDNQAYPDQPSVTLNIDPATSGTDFINPKQVRLAVTSDAAGSTVVKTMDVTPSSTGGATGTYDVDDGFSAASADYYLQLGVNATLGNASTPAGQKPGLAGVATVNGLTASQQSWVIFDNSHDAAYTQISESQVRDAGATTIDPRARGVRANGALGFFFMKDRAAFDTDFDDTTNQMLTSEVGQAAIRIINARGEGLNGLDVTLTADPQNPGATETVLTSTANRDGQDGWTGLVDVCKLGKPGGTWDLAADITAPAAIDAATHLTGNTSQITVLSVDPRIRVVVYLGQSGAGASGRHLEPGDSLKATVTAFSTETRKRLVPDTGTVGLTLIRWNEGLSRFEYVQSDGTTWAEWSGTGTAATSITMTDSGDGVTFTTTLATTNGWGLHDIVAVNVVLKVSGTPYSEYTPREMVASNHRHDEAPASSGGFMGRYAQAKNIKSKDARKAVEQLRRILEQNRQAVEVEQRTVVVEKLADAVTQVLETNDDEDAIAAIIALVQ